MAGARDIVQVPTDGAGKKLDSYSYDLADGRGTTYANTGVIVDQNGNAVDSLAADASGNTVGLGVSLMATNFVASTNNSSTAQLAANATFTGTIETVYNQQTISLLIVSDQTLTVHVMQYITASAGTKISDWSFTVTAGVPFSRAFIANGNYFNLTALNTSGSTATTTLNINTAYGILTPATTSGTVPVEVTAPMSKVPVVCYGTVGGASSETAIAVTIGRSLAAQSGSAVSQAITTGRTLRVMSLTFSCMPSTTTAFGATFSLRYNPTGAVTTSSPQAGIWRCGVIAAVANAGAHNVINFTADSAIELPAISSAGQFGFTFIASAATGNVYVTLVGYEY